MNPHAGWPGLDWSSASLVDAEAMRRRALAAETDGDPHAALLAWERIIDRSPAGQEQRREAYEHVAKLGSNVPPVNLDPARAKPWRTLAVVHRRLDVRCPDAQGTPQRYEFAFTEQDGQSIRAAMATFADYVFRFTSGVIALDTQFAFVEEPLTQMEQVRPGKFWPGLKTLRPAMARAMGDRHFDCVVNYVKVADESGRKAPVPWSADASGADEGINGACPIVCAWRPGRFDGEVELHEWLHHVDMILMWVLGYPDGVNVDPDGCGSDRFYRKPAGDSLPGFMGFYEHIMRVRYTRLMWQELSVAPVPGAFWAGNCAKDWLVCGPFGPRNNEPAMETDFIGEATVRPIPAAKSAGRPWTPVQAVGRRVPASTGGTGAREAVMYLATAFTRRGYQTGLEFRSPGPVAVFLNGRALHRRMTPTPPEGVTIPIGPRQGTNLLLFKTCPADADWAVQARLVDDDGGTSFCPGYSLPSEGYVPDPDDTASPQRVI